MFQYENMFQIGIRRFEMIYGAINPSLQELRELYDMLRTGIQRFCIVYIILIC